MTEIINNSKCYKIGAFMWYDDNIKEYAEINYKINKIYCEKYGYTLIKSNERLYSERKPHWERIPLLLKYIDEFDYLIWIDADAHFFIDSPPITNIIDQYPDTSLFFSEDQCCKNIKFTSQLNSGVFIIKNCQYSKNFLHKWGYDNELFNLYNGNYGWNDQAILVKMYDKNIDNIVDNMVIIKYGVLQYFDKEFKLPLKLFGLTNKGFIFHMAGYKTDKRKQHSNEYYETNVVRYKYQKFINSKIQLANKVITDILFNCENKKMLVFGLGYDSELWYNATNKNTFFIENNQKYIELNKNINSNNIIYHEYNNISVKTSMQLNDTQIQDFKIPIKILEQSPFDIILIDGPNGFDDKCPGRLLPIYWSSKLLSKESTIIYVDDATRNLEKKCINKYFINKPKTYFSDRLGTIKIIM